MSHQDTPSQPPPPGSKPPGPTGPTPSGPGTGPTAPGGRHPRQSAGSGAAWAAGGTVFAGLMLLIGGVMAILEGIVGIHRDAVLAQPDGGYAYRFSSVSWGWIHLVLGVVALLVGYGVLRGAAWARWAGMLIAGLNMIANFMFLPYQPVWAIVMVAVDVFVIWALATYHPADSRSGGVLS
jgi:hypothetical protein